MNANTREYVSTALDRYEVPSDILTYEISYVGNMNWAGLLK